jgi:tetratricopeptide (TPR) repeat protein
VAVIPDPDEQRWVEPRLASLLGVEAGPAREREDLFAAWRLFYERLAAEMPTVMVFEDLHWADDALLDFIDYLMEWSRNHRLFVLTLARHELLERRPDWASARRNSTPIHLEPLAGGAMEDLLSGLAPGLPEALSARVLDRAEGVPLYAVETVRMLLDRGLLTQEEGGFRPTGSIEELDVPETLHGLLAARLDGLEPDERRLMQDASVLGKTFAKEAIAAVSGAAPDRLEEMLAALLRKELLAVEAERFSPERGQYVFLGDLVRWVAYETLSKKERKSRHLAVASWFEQLTEEDAIEMVAGHYLRAYEAEPGAEDAASIRDRAQLALTKAAERAASLGANAEAGRRFEQAAQMAGSDLDRAGLLERAGGMAMRELDHERARELFSEGMSIYERHSLSHPAARVSARLAELDYIQGHLEDAIARMREAFDVLSTEEHDRDLAMLAGALGRMHFFLGEMGQAAQMIEVALEIGERLALPDVISDALNTKSIIVSAHGRYEEGSALITHALEIAVEHDLPTTALRAYNNVAETETDRDRYDDGLSQYERGLALAERVGDGVWLRGLRSETVFPLLMTGRWDEALESAAKVPDSEKAGPDIIGLLVSIPVIHIARGDIDAAEQIVHLFDRYGRSSDVQQTAAFACARASVLRARSRNEEAMASAREAVEGGLQLGTIATMKIGLTQGLAAAFALGDLVAVEQQIGIVDGMTPGMVTPFLRALADRWRARVVAARGGDAGVESAFKTSIGLFREMGVPYWRAITQVEYGEWLMSAGRFEDAKPAFEESRETFEYLSASARLEQLDRIAEPLRVD